ncbi:succinyl-diaminopimelate desuccinylase [Myxococcus stipitatus DSM 14675]|uniref:Succinyl-diaminopimelate desuccinylase n=1 Tax=Myxococcus stipitatus (strain DSM 14675 / JCM 12634 / Mx s8) TaxID=1278073 RepID=L7UQ24_MYXSD|nr:succinyl-diaminopimelate desuccinylase [Myxococcus stipitatus]AGC48659.1 succinyl-diaminopimelate desuccinylase [Myxococcus stipitatus DSM 14675]
MSSSQDLATRLARTTLELCRISSPITQEGPIADFTERWALQHFPAKDVCRVGHTLLLGNLDDPRPTVALIGHLDTVPAHPSDQGRVPRIEGERVFGLGASDMKGGLAVMMALAEDLRRDTLPVNLAFLFYEREEGAYAESGLIPLFAKRPDLARVKFGIAMEPTDSEVQVGCVGSMQATVRFTGRSAHSARPWQGENAIHKAGPFLAELLAKQRVEVDVDGFRFYEVINATLAKGGRARNVIPEAFELNLNYRFAPGKSIEQAKADVHALVAGRAEVEISDASPSGPVVSGNPLFQKLLAITGLPAASKQAWTDVARFGEWGVDAINYGPGETAQAHQANESAPIAPLAVAYEKLAAFLKG